MKTLVVALALVLPMIGRADEKNVLAGRYSGCVDRTAYTNGTPSSKRYVFTFGEEFSLDIVATSYLGTAKCDNEASGTYEYKAFQVMDDSGNHPGRFVTAQDLRTKLYFKFVIAKSYTAIYASEKYPIKGDFVEMMLLYREL